MKRLPYFVVLAFACGFPALAADLEGNYVPRVSLKDAPLISRDLHRHDPAKLTTRYICYEGDGIYPRVCDVAANKPRAPDARLGFSGAR